MMERSAKHLLNEDTKKKKGRRRTGWEEKELGFTEVILVGKKDTDVEKKKKPDPETRLLVKPALKGGRNTEKNSKMGLSNTNEKTGTLKIGVSRSGQPRFTDHQKKKLVCW